MSDTQPVKKPRTKKTVITVTTKAATDTPAPVAQSLVNEKTPIPTLDYILITKTKPDEVSAGGIFLPGSTINDERRGIVVAVGPNVGLAARAVNPDCRIPASGDVVFFSEYSGLEIEHESKQYLLMKESAVLCILP